MDAVSKIRAVRHRWRRRRSREPGAPQVRDRLVEDAGLALRVLARRQISDDDALDGLVRHAFGSADRLLAAVAGAQASGRPDAELDLLARAAARARAGTGR